jgi:ATP-dependent helicase/nuclease subunit A
MPVKYYPTLQQHLATDYRRNLAVTAGAGTGKTEVLTRRIIRILSREKHYLDRLLVLTFTDKAAVEMKERIYGAIENELLETGEQHFQKLKDTFFNNCISTFHSFCADLLREYPIEAGIDPYFRVLDETEKVFFLRKSIKRSLKELASDKNNKDIHILSGELSRSAISNSIFAIIQKREDMSSWIDGFAKLEQQSYMERLEKYRDCILREMSYKLYKSGDLNFYRKKLADMENKIPWDDSALNKKRNELLKLLPLLEYELEPASSESINYDRVLNLKKEIIKNSRLSKAPQTWSNEAYNIIKEIFIPIRYLINSFAIEDFDIAKRQEEYGFEILQALARITGYCLRTYQEDKANENYLDFQDLQLKVLNLFSEEKYRHIPDELRKRFLFIMVDEFQDTNGIQWQIIKKIAADQTESIINPRLFIVGDEKQAIYSFRGGDVTLFSRVRKELKKANRIGGHDLQPFDLILEGQKDYTVEYRENTDEISTSKTGEIVFVDNFRSAAVPINFFNMFFHDLLSRKVYEEYDARPQRLVCAGNKTEGSVELMLVDKGSPEDRETINLSDHYKEALMIVEKIKEVFLGEGEKYRRVREYAKKGQSSIAILLNRRTMIKTYEDALRMNRIDFTVVRGRGFFQRQEIVDMGNLLSFLANPEDNLSLVGFLRSPAGHLSDEGIFLLSKTDEKESLFEQLISIAQTDKSTAEQMFSPRDYRAIVNAATSLQKWMRLAGHLPLPELLSTILNEGGYYVSLCRGTRGEQAVSNIEKLLDSARIMSIEENGDLADFSEWLNNRIDYIDEEGEADVDISLGGAVQIMTVHQAKGLEFPMVFVPDIGAFFNLGERDLLHAGNVPYAMSVGETGINRKELPEIGINAPNPENEWENEPLLIKRIIKKRMRDELIAEKKRLFYVAATRAMDHLVLVGHSDFNNDTVIQRIFYSPLDELINWMDWLNKIVGLSIQVNSLHGTVKYENEAGTPMEIPYRMFSSKDARFGSEAEYRTEFQHSSSHFENIFRSKDYSLTNPEQ